MMPRAVSSRPWLLAGLVLLAPVLSGLHFALRERPGMPFESEHELVRVFQARANTSARLFYLDHRPLSASFYTAGRARAISLIEALNLRQPYWLAVHRTLGNRPPGQCKAQYHPATGSFDLYLCNG